MALMFSREERQRAKTQELSREISVMTERYKKFEYAVNLSHNPQDAQLLSLLLERARMDYAIYVGVDYTAVPPDFATMHLSDLGNRLILTFTVTLQPKKENLENG